MAEERRVFGGDPRGVDGTTCIAVPPAVDSLVAQLRALDALELSKESCASVFPDGFNF